MFVQVPPMEQEETQYEIVHNGTVYQVNPSRVMGSSQFFCKNYVNAQNKLVICDLHSEPAFATFIGLLSCKNTLVNTNDMPEILSLMDEWKCPKLKEHLTTSIKKVPIVEAVEEPFRDLAAPAPIQPPAPPPQASLPVPPPAPADAMPAPPYTPPPVKSSFHPPPPLPPAPPRLSSTEQPTPLPFSFNTTPVQQQPQIPPTSPLNLPKPSPPHTSFAPPPTNPPPQEQPLPQSTVMGNYNIQNNISNPPSSPSISPKLLKVHIKTRTGNKYSIEVSPENTISEFKKLIKAKTGIDEDRQVLFINNAIPLDEATIKSLQINSKTNIFLEKKNDGYEFPVFIQHADGTETPYMIGPTAKIKDLINMISIKESTPRENLSLIYKARRLDEEHSISDYSIDKNSRIFLVVR